MKSSVRVMFVHGLESGPGGAKAQYLQRHFVHVSAPDMRTGGFNLQSNSYLRHGMSNLLTIFSGRYSENVTQSLLDAVVNILRMQPQEYDVIVGSSMGGASALEAAKRGAVCGPMILLAPALKRVVTFNASEERSAELMSEWYSAFNKTVSEEMKKCMLVVHGVLDETVPIDHSREFCNASGVKLLEISDGDHRLNNFCLDGDFSDIDQTAVQRQDKLRALIEELVSGAS